MKIRLYMNEWFYNMGLVGLMRAFNFASIPYNAKNNYLEFDSQYLEGLQDVYFDYFINDYNFKKRYIDKFEIYINDFKNNKRLDNTYKKTGDFLKKLTKKIANTKYSDAFENYMKEFEKYKKDISKNIDKIIDILRNIQSLIDNNDIKTLYGIINLRNMLFDNFFGQASFLQKSLANKSKEEQTRILYKDYIYPIIFDIEFFNNINNVNKNLQEELDKDKLLNKDRIKVYKNFLKDSKKSANKIDELKNEFYTCSLCNSYKSYDQVFSESMFLPLGISNDNAKNFKWNQDSIFPICDICKLVFLFAPIGANRTYSYSDGKERNIFINLDTEINTLLNVNDTFKYRSDYSSDNPFNELIFDIIGQYKQKAFWTLQNILFVDFSAEYQSKKSSLYYFSLPLYLAKFFDRYAHKTLNYIHDKKFNNILIESILKNKSLNNSIFNQLIKILKEGGNSTDIYFSVLAKCLINYCKINSGSDDKVIYYKIKKIYDSGIDIYRYLKSSNQENKVNSIAYRLLNAAKVGNKKELMDTLLRLYINAGKNIPKEFLDIFNQREVDTESLAQAFIAGLTSQNVNQQSDEKIQGEDVIDE